MTRISQLNRLKLVLRNGTNPGKWDNFLFNRLETAVLPFNKRLARLRKEMGELSGGSALMSGSGSSIYAVAGDKERAKHIAKKVKKKARMVFSTSLLGRKNDENN